MSVRFEGWTGDSATPLADRKPMQALVAITFPQGMHWLDGIELDDPVDFVKIVPVVEGRAPAFATRISWAGPSFWAIDVGVAPGAWPAGVNLVHISFNSFDPKLPESKRWSVSTFATVIVPSATQTKMQKTTKQKTTQRRPRPGDAPIPSRRGT